MDPTQITALVTAAFAAISPYLPNLAEKAAEKIGSELPEAVGKLWKNIHEKLSKKESGTEAVKDLLANPEDTDAQGQFRHQLKKLLTEDHEFLKELEYLVKDTGTQISYHAEFKGSGAIAQGQGAKAVGERGVMIGGSANDAVIITGDKNEEEKKDKK